MARRAPTSTAEYRALEPEAAFQTWVIDLARLRGWLCAHVRDSRRQDTDGLPDLVCARNGVVILLELKTARGKTSPKQDAWLAAAGGHLFRPGERDAVSRLLW